MTATPPADPFGFDRLDPEWVRAKGGAKWRLHRGQLNAWVADMDFAPAREITDAIAAVAATNDLGYPNWGYPRPKSPVCEVFAERAARRYGWTIEPDHVEELCEVVQAVQLALYVGTAAGDGVVLHTPSYPPLWKSLAHMGRRQIDVPATIDAAGVHFDHDELDRRLEREQATAILLCHPHNPTGHRFDREELVRLAEIAERHDLLIISDEIHADLTYSPASHVPIASLSPETAARTVTVHSASKAFNIAGMRHAVVHLGATHLRARIAELPDHLTGMVNITAAAAAAAAWQHGDEWLAALLVHLDRQRTLALRLVAQHLPSVVAHPPDATYLAWLDCRAIGDGDEPHRRFHDGGVEVSPGLNFGPLGSGHVRLNFATSAAMLTTIIEAMAAC